MAKEFLYPYQMKAVKQMKNGCILKKARVPAGAQQKNP